MGAPQYEQAGADIGGTGTPNTIPRWTGPSTLGDSGITDNGTVIGVANGARTLAFNLLQISGNTLTTSTAELALQYATSRDTTIYAPAASVALFVKGTTGNVGIGTASPQEKLQIYGDLKVGVLASGSFVTLADETSTQKNVGIARLAGDTSLTVAGYGGIRFYASTTQVTSQVERMRINNAGTQAQSQVAIGTSSFTSGRALTTVADLDVFGVRVGRGPGDIATNTAIGAGALSFCTTGSENTALGQNAGFGISTGVRNVMIGAATGSGGTVTGSRNIVVGRQAGNQLTSGSDNVLLGTQAGDSITTGSSNIVIGCGAGADVAAATDSNKLVIGDATNYVATNGGATTYYATAGALAGYIIVRLNGTDVKLPVYAL